MIILFFALVKLLLINNYFVFCLTKHFATMMKTPFSFFRFVSQQVTYFFSDKVFYSFYLTMKVKFELMCAVVAYSDIFHCEQSGNLRITIVSVCNSLRLLS